MHLTPAGYWYVFVSVPLFQFILLRWYFRFLLWFWFLWRVSRLNLRLRPDPPGPGRRARLPGRQHLCLRADPLRPERPAGRADRQPDLLCRTKPDGVQGGGGAVPGLLHGHRPQPAGRVRTELARASRRHGYCGSLASRFVDEFEEKWVQGGARGALGSATSVLADLGNSYTVVQETRLVPFGWKDVTWLAAAAAVPLLPLVLTRLLVGGPAGPGDLRASLTRRRHGYIRSRRDA